MPWLTAGLLFGCLLAGYSTHVRRDAENIKGFRIIDGLCMNKRSDRLVYRYKNETYVYIAFDMLKTGIVDIFSWDIVKSNKGTFISSKMNEEQLPAIDFRKTVNRAHVLGATNKRHMKRFKRRMERKMSHCRKLYRKKSKHCKLTAIQIVLARMAPDIRNVTFTENFEDCKT